MYVRPRITSTNSAFFYQPHRKKKKKSKEHKHKLEAHTSRAEAKHSDDEQAEEQRPDRLVKVEMTKAEKAFKKMQEKKRLERVSGSEQLSGRSLREKSRAIRHGHGRIRFDR